jgi:hypothetical protein
LVVMAAASTDSFPLVSWERRPDGTVLDRASGDTEMISESCQRRARLVEACRCGDCVRVEEVATTPDALTIQDRRHGSPVGGERRSQDVDTVVRPGRPQ